MERRWRASLLALITLLATLAIVGVAQAAFPADPPNDPSYDPTEEGGLATCQTKSVNDEQHYLFTIMPQCSPAATDPENAPGMFIGDTARNPTDASAWRNYTAGNGQTTIAYIEGGINWHNGDAQELRKRVFLNAGELPNPTTPVADGQLNVDDYNDQPVVDDNNGNNNGFLDPEDLIVRFSDGNDDDGNGYTDDISGWDFYNDQNDPATLDSTYGHANGQMKQAAAEADNGIGDVGVCPRCMILPVKAGAEALDRTDDLAQAWLFAGDSGADVIVSVTADLGYSTFMSQAVDKLWQDGIVMVEASNDFNSTDHQGGMFHQHVLPGNSVVSNSQGIPNSPVPLVPPPSNALTTTYRARASYPEWGTHNMFTPASAGGTTSESTPTVGGVMGLVLAYGKEAVAPGGPLDGDPPLSGQEAIQVVRDTAHDIDSNPASPLPGWEGKPGFDLQYGYGRPNVLKAMQHIEAGNIPPVAWIDSPDWYAVFDPNKTSTVPVTGHVEAQRSSVQDWKVEYATGAEPTDGDFTTFGSGTTPVSGSGPLGDLDLGSIPGVQAFCAAQFQLSTTKTLETNEKYTVTIRVQVTDAQGRVGEERRTIAVRCDDSMADGFPKKIGPGGESQPVLADIQGTGELAIIFGESDGAVHAIRPNGDELPGWPVTTDAVDVTKSHPGIDPGHEPIVPGVAVGDLDGDGRLSIVATSTSGRTYAWDADGNRRPGWPNALDDNVSAPNIPRPDDDFTRPPIMGATASPVLADMNNDGALEVIQAGWDGAVHIWRPNGTNLTPPIRPPAPTPGAGETLINDSKLVVPPAVAQLDSDAAPEIVVRSQYNESPGGGDGLKILGADPPGGTTPPRSHLYAYNGDGTVVGAGWNPATIDALAMYYGSAQEFITEGANAPVTADTDGDGKSETLAAAGIFSPTYTVASNGSTNPTPYGPTAAPPFAAGLIDGTISAATLTDLLNGDVGTDEPVNFTTSGAFGKFGATNTLSYAEPGSGAASVAGSLLLAGSGIPVNNYLSLHDTTTNAPVPGFPAKTQGLDFLGAPAIADVTGDGKPEVIEGGDSSALHAFTDGGGQAAGFPKFMSGWILFGPAVGDIDSDGKSEVVAMTREGYLDVWKTDGTYAGNQEWWNYRHDERNTADYDLDTRPPGVVRDATLAADGTLTFTAPGDDWYGGTADHYLINGGPQTQPVGGPAGTAETLQLAPGINAVIIQAVDEAGNKGVPLIVRLNGENTPGEPVPGNNAAAGGAGAGSSTGALTLKLRPKRAHVGKRTCFRFTVSSNGAPIEGATVNIGRKRKITQANGTARVCRTFHSAKRVKAKAQKTGYTPAKRKIRVRH